VEQSRLALAPAAAPGGFTVTTPRRLLVVEERPRGLLCLVAESAIADLSGDHDAAGPVQIRTAVGAEEAAAMLAAEPYHCVVLDLDMADGGAEHLLQARAEDPALDSVPMLVHHSRRLDPVQEQRFRLHGKSYPLEVLSSLDEVRERIVSHLTGERPDGVVPLLSGEELRPVEAPDSGGRLAGRTVLVVDDDPRNVFALTGMLEMHGMNVIDAEDGLKGIEALKQDPSIELILMDVMMPEMDGYEATARIRTMPDFAHLPIIAVTAKAMRGDREKSLSAGANDYVTKPVDQAVLIERIQKALGL
jgi:CheY-like chemotaxis protein